MKWLRTEIANGLQALLALRLKNTPAEDMIELTADIWYRAFSQRVSVETIDAPRIREGFQRIFPKTREWPAPLDVIEQMPDRPQQQRLPAPQMSDEEHAHNSSRFDEIMRGLVERVSI